MIMSVGLGAPAESMFHLTTHAFFKALLFLGAGSVIVALHHEQDIWKMGKLRSKMPVTYWTFLVGTLALAGIWPFSGFFSKDSILAAALAFPNPVLRYLLFGLGLFVAALTAFYMFRLVFVVFGGAAKSDAADHAHETAPVILWPLRFLAVFSLIAGVIGAEEVYRIHFTSELADHAGAHLSMIEQLFLPFAHSPVAAVSGLLAAGAGIAAAWSFYGKTATDPLPDRLGAFGEAMRNRFYFDELYQGTVIPIHEFLASMANWFDRMIIDGFCIGLVRYGTDLLGRTTRFVQTGNLQTYALLFALGVALLLYLVLK
jgi:NADH-quinone oxidoreductase subunit L